MCRLTLSSHIPRREQPKPIYVARFLKKLHKNERNGTRVSGARDPCIGSANTVNCLLFILKLLLMVNFFLYSMTQLQMVTADAESGSGASGDYPGFRIRQSNIINRITLLFNTSTLTLDTTNINPTPRNYTSRNPTPRNYTPRNPTPRNYTPRNPTPRNPTSRNPTSRNTQHPHPQHHQPLGEYYIFCACVV